MKTVQKIAFLSAVCCALFQCSKNDDTPPAQEPRAEQPITGEPKTEEPAADPKLTGIAPEVGKNGTEVTISGTDLGTDPDAVTVTFNGNEATVQSVTDTAIVATAPDDAGDGPVQVTVESSVLEGPVFTYQNPNITGISPNNGPKTTLVTVNGIHFGEDASKVAIFFNGKQGEVQSVTNNRMVAIVPPRAFSGLVTLSVDGTELVGPEFEYLISDVQVTTVAGSSQGSVDGPGSSALFAGPRGIALGSQGNLYIADTFNNQIRKMDSESNVTTFSDHPLWRLPHDLVTDDLGNVYVTDNNNDVIKKITPSGSVSTFAGSSRGFSDGSGLSAQFNLPMGIAIDIQNNFYVADRENFKIRKITPDGVVSTLAGSTEGFADGPAETAQFSGLWGLTADDNGNLYICDGSRIRKLTPDGTVSTLTGSTFGFVDGNLDNALFGRLFGITIDMDQNIYVADGANNSIRKITPSGRVSTLAGGNEGDRDGSGPLAQFSAPEDVVIDGDRTLFVADRKNHRIRKITQE